MKSVILFLPEDERNERHGHDQDVEQVESRPAKRPRVQDKPVRYDLQADFNGEDGREEVIEIVQDLEQNVIVTSGFEDCDCESYFVPFGIGIERVLGGQHGGRHHDTDQDDISEVGVIADKMAHDTKPVIVKKMDHQHN